MTLQLPPLNTLRAFEAAARHLSFKRASEELFVTPSAISHQIRVLEELLGARLFLRQRNRLVLTEVGMSYVRRIADPITRISQATRDVISGREGDLVTVHSAASFGVKWLRPRLGAFLDQNPGLATRLNATTEMVDFSHSRADIAVVYGNAQPPGLHLEPLATEHVEPACSPGYLARAPALHRPGDLPRHRLIHANNIVTWKDWLAGHAVDAAKENEPERGLWFDRSHMAIDAAVDGLGVILESDLLIEAELAAGTLVRPLAHLELARSVPAYFLAMPPEHARVARVQRFRDWLRAAIPARNAVAGQRDIADRQAAQA